MMRRVPSMAEIQQATKDHFGLHSVVELKGPRRSSSLAHARMVAIFMCRELTKASYKEIGAEFGGRDHTTVRHSLQTIREKLNHEGGFGSTGSLQQHLKSIEARVEQIVNGENGGTIGPITLHPSGQFNSLEHWVATARNRLAGSRGSACFDQKGRLCLNGADFKRARDENAFPVVYFLPEE